ncbi:hypothetical protein HDU81_003856 [Chytriomyces hyalinus]|nr:hypothetical protein HDU81_003856 [Chytriomyces hyalinus]
MLAILAMQHLVPAFAILVPLNSMGRMRQLSHSMRLSRAAADSKDKFPVVSHTFSQTVDHFGTDGRRFSQTYFVGDSYYVAGRPVILLIQGEAPATDAFLTTGVVKEMARHFGALVVSLEHRFYGSSMPTDDFTAQSLSLLTTKQAIADILEFKKSLPALYPNYTLTDNTKWIAVGGSYPGVLAAILRQKYPNEFHAAHASSAPVQMLVDFWRFAYSVDEAIPTFPEESGSTACAQGWAETVKQFDAVIDEYIATNDTTGLESFRKRFWMDKVENLGDFTSAVTTVLGLSAMYGPGGSTWQKLDNGTNVSWIKAVCSQVYYPAFTNPAATPKERLDALADLIVTNLRKQQMYTGSDDPYLVGNYSSTLIATDTSIQNDILPWAQQYCTEFGYFQTTVPQEHWISGYTPYSKYLTVDYYTWSCNTVLGRADKTTLPNVKATNEMYGGLNMDETRIYWVNGRYDPWHWLSIYDASIVPNPDGQSWLLLPQGNHCSDLGMIEEDAHFADMTKVWEGWLPDISPASNGAAVGTAAPTSKKSAGARAFRFNALFSAIVLWIVTVSV